MRRVLACGAGLLALFCAGCASTPEPHPGVFPGRLPDLEVDARPAPVSDGSLYADGGAAELIGDFRARHVGDVLVVQVNESSLGTSSADSKLDKTATSDLEAPTPLGYAGKLAGKLGADFDPAVAYSIQNEQAFNGKGATNRQNTLNARIAVRVMAVGTGGRMVVAGTKEITVNREKQYLTLAGIVRPEDVAADNVIASNAIADLTISFAGNGDVAETMRQGWFTKLLHKIWPF